jgi:hypothetical protein
MPGRIARQTIPQTILGCGTIVTMATPPGQLGHTSSAVIRSQRIWTADGKWRYTGEFEIICCDCGDDPALDYAKVSPLLRRLRGPYRTLERAQAALERHCGRNTWRARYL